MTATSDYYLDVTRSKMLYVVQNDRESCGQEGVSDSTKHHDCHPLETSLYQMQPIEAAVHTYLPEAIPDDVEVEE